MKKLLALVMTLVLCLSVAFAESTPSKTAGDMIAAEVISGGDDTLLIIPDEIDTPEYLDEVDQLAALVEDNGSIAAYVGLDADENTVIECHEIIEVYAIGTVEDGADEAKVKFVFPTVYTKDQTVWAALGFLEEGKIVYTIYDAEVDEDGAIVVTLPASVVERLLNETALMVVLNTPAE